MANRYNLAAEIRDKKASSIRRKGFIPAVLYGHDLDSMSVQVEEKEFSRVFNQTGSTSLVMVTINSTEHPVLIREVQYHPLKNKALHIDFYQVRMDEEITAEVPLTFVGESAAVKDLGGVFVRNMDSIEVEALPQNLPHDIEVDISSLNTFEDIIHVRDLKLPEGVKTLQEIEEVVALVQEPKTQEQIDADLAEEVKEEVAAVEGVEDKKEETVEGAEPAATEEKKE
ncbi:MAG: 50S ribosomal protein L25 [Candidatus Andersenbacteria bacterium]